MSTALDSHALDSFRRAGAVIAECREWARGEIRPGVAMRRLLETVEEMIRARGAQPSFPAQSSRNEIAAHYCPSPDDPLVYEEGDCVKLDIGAHIDGYVVDTACTIDLSADGRWAPLIRATVDALDAVIDMAVPGVAVGDLGATVGRTIAAAGFKPVRNLAGHGVGRWRVHQPPNIPNIANGDPTKLSEGMTIAVEPFASTGSGLVGELGTPEVFMLVAEPRRRRAFDAALLSDLEAWHGLPVARRYFASHDPELVDQTIGRLIRQRAMVAYPPLVEKAAAMVAQTEHTLLIGPHGAEVLTG
jgi:methionyl aminopeptidase